METIHLLGIDAGGTKTAWGVFDQDLHLVRSGRFPTPADREEFISSICDIIEKEKVKAVGMGIAGTVSADHQDIVVFPNIPSLSHLELGRAIQEKFSIPVSLDNDARCALIGEVVKGTAASDTTSAVFITIGTGIGGAVMQKGIILPHPHDITQEISHIQAEPLDAFSGPSGRGTIESLIGGKNLETRLGIKLNSIAEKVRKGDKDANDVWKQISYYFIQSIRAIYMTYSCRVIIVGGIGAEDLEYYLQEEPPCPVIAATLGGKAGMYGAAQLALDVYTEEQKDWE
jgi:glucokinase